MFASEHENDRPSILLGEKGSNVVDDKKALDQESSERIALADCALTQLSRCAPDASAADIDWAVRQMTRIRDAGELVDSYLDAARQLNATWRADLCDLEEWLDDYRRRAAPSC